MKFKNVSFIERNYRKLSFLLVVLATIGCCVWFVLGKESSAVSFYAPIAYALALYLIGAFSQAISSKISNSFFEKLGLYQNFKKVEESFNSFDKLYNNDIKHIGCTIHTLRILTGRTEDKKANEKPYIKHLGITYDNDYLETEQLFLKTYNEIRTCLDERLRSFITTKNIKSKKQNINIDENVLFEPDLWCKETFEDGKCVLNEIYAIFSEKSDSFEKMQDAIEKICKYYVESSCECKKAIAQIEKLYGNKLADYLEQEKWHYSDIEYIRGTVSEAESNLSKQIEALQEDLDSLSNDCNEMKSAVELFFDHFEGEL